MTAKQLEETLAAIAKKAKALREAGIVGRVTVGEVSFELAQPEPPAAEAGNEPVTHALDDPDTFGGDMPQRRSTYSAVMPSAQDDEET